MKRLWFVLSLVAILAMMLACGPQPAPSPTPTSVPSPTATAKPSATPTAAPSATPTPTSQIKTGGTLRYWLASTPAGFDVHRKPGYGPTFGNPVFNNLVRFDPLKFDINPENIVPDLAEKWDVSADGKTITFYLRKGVKWHDGTPFTAEDVVYSMTKMVDPQRSVLAASFAMFDRIEKVDDFTVKIYLKYASPSFMVQIAGPFTNIQPKHKASVDWRVTDFLVGTGPYKFKAATVGVSYDLVKNPDYFKKGVPYLDGLTIYVITDRSAQVDAFASGKIDLTNPTVGIANQESLDRFRTQIKSAVIKPQGTQQGMILWYNMKKSGPLQDVRVRRALALMLDPKQITTAAYGNDEWGEFNHAFMPGSYGIPKAEIDKLLGRDKPFADRVTEAQKLMADAGFAGGFQISLTSVRTAEYERAVTLMADVWRRNLKVDCQLILRDSAEARKSRDAGDFDIFWDQTLNPLGEPDDLMPYFVTGSPGNISMYSNTKLDQMWQQQSQTIDIAKRRLITQDIERGLLAELPSVPTTFQSFFAAYQPYVKNYVLQAAWYTSNIAFEQTWLDK